MRWAYHETWRRIYISTNDKKDLSNYYSSNVSFAYNICPSFFLSFQRNIMHFLPLRSTKCIHMYMIIRKNRRRHRLRLINLINFLLWILRSSLRYTHTHTHKRNEQLSYDFKVYHNFFHAAYIKCFISHAYIKKKLSLTTWEVIRSSKKKRSFSSSYRLGVCVVNKNEYQIENQYFSWHTTHIYWIKDKHKWCILSLAIRVCVNRDQKREM